MARQVRSIAIALVAAASVMVLRASPVAAECPYLPAWPPITAARVVVVGEIVTDFDQADRHLGADEGRRDYALRVTEVLRGDRDVGDLLDVQYLLPNWPQTRFAGSDGTLASCTYLPAAPGDVIAIAFDAVQPGGRMKDGDRTWLQPPTRYNGVGVIWTTQAPDDDVDPWHEREHVTLRQLRSLASLPMTDADKPARESPAGPPIALLAGLAAGLLAARRFRGQRLP